MQGAYAKRPERTRAVRARPLKSAAEWRKILTLCLPCIIMGIIRNYVESAEILQFSRRIPGEPMGPEKQGVSENGELRKDKTTAEPGEKQARGKRFLRRAVNIVAGTVVVSAVATEIVFLIIFGRTKPVDRSSFPLGDWAEQNGCSWADVEFLSGENTLRGYVVSPRAPSALIMIAHGMNSSSRGFEPVIEFFVQKGYAVFIFDGTASGRSDGERVIGLQQARFDIRAAIDFINNEPKYSKLPLAVLGHSSGAYGAATEAGSPAVDAVVCISAFDSPIRTMHAWARNYTHILSDLQYPFMAAHEYDQLGFEANTSAAAALLSSGTPALVIHGSEDSTVPLPLSLYQKLSAAAPERITLMLEHTSGHCGHGDIIVTEAGELNTDLVERIDRFLRSVLPGAGSR